jgi:sugar phosphate permease
VKGKPRLFYGWWILVAGLVIVISGVMGREFFRSQLPVTLKEQFSFSAPTLGWVFGIFGLAGSVASLVIGPLIDRFGPRKVMLTGISLTGIGFLLLGYTNSIVVFYIILGALLGVGMQAGFLLPVQTATANWFIKRRSIALAVIAAASVLGEAVIILSPEQFVSQIDWRVTFTGLGVLVLVVCIPLSFIIRHRPEQHGSLPDGKLVVTDEESESGTETTSHVSEVNFTLWQALKTRAFWLLTIAMALSIGLNSIVPAYRYVFLFDAGFSQAEVVNIFHYASLMGLAGILIFGYLGDRFPKRYLLALAVAIQSASTIILMTAGTGIQIYLYTLVYGLGSGTVPLMLAIRADYFGRRKFASITVATVFISGLISVPLSMPWIPLSGWFIEITSSYLLLFLLSMLLGLIPAVVFFFARPPNPPQSRTITDR